MYLLNSSSWVQAIENMTGSPCNLLQDSSGGVHTLQKEQGLTLIHLCSIMPVAFAAAPETKPSGKGKTDTGKI